MTAADEVDLTKKGEKAANASLLQHLITLMARKGKNTNAVAAVSL